MPDSLPEDLSNPGCVKGWAIIRMTPWEFVKIFKTEAQAREYSSHMNLDSSHQVEHGSHRVGTDDFVY